MNASNQNLLPYQSQWLSVYKSDNDVLSYDCVYKFPQGKLFILNAKIVIDAEQSQITKKAISSARTQAVIEAMQRHKPLANHLPEDEETYFCLLVVEVIIKKGDKQQKLRHRFGSSFFIEEFVMEIEDKSQVLQVFASNDWQDILDTVKTPCDLWRFLAYHFDSLMSGEDFDNEKQLLTNFMDSMALFEKAIEVDNALVKYNLRQEPSPTLVDMALAQKNHNDEMQVYHDHIHKSATMWEQLCGHVTYATASPKDSPTGKKIAITPSSWVRQLLSESLFSRYELVRVIYDYHKQPEEKKQTGYVVHQHSYESLGRHYVIIFYSKEENLTNSRSHIQPRLDIIAKDVITRLNLPELHHIIVMGVSFIKEANETFIDLDVFIQPATVMNANERYLQEQLKALQQRNRYSSI